jgi:hypothetical protein
VSLHHAPRVVQRLPEDAGALQPVLRFVLLHQSDSRLFAQGATSSGLEVATATLVSSVLLYLFGRVIFSVFGITVDAFRIHLGAGHGSGQVGGAD